MLTLLELAAQQAGEGGGRQVPWFGAIQGFCQVGCRAAACCCCPIGLVYFVML